MTDIVEHTGDGAILYDTAILNQISDSTFTPAHWAIATRVEGALRSAGRGNTVILSNGGDEFVLRHYIRGGLPGKFVRDLYLWKGESQTRSFAEWRLLAKLQKKRLPVPVPVAARYQRRGMFYRADLITARIPGIRSLADRLLENSGSREFWNQLGAGLQRFHEAGAYHADMNAYNVQVDADDNLYLLDFDRGALREPGVWRQQNLARLHRSLRKVSALEPKISFAKAHWDELLEGYFSASKSA